MLRDGLPEDILIRFDGLDADTHELDMSGLAESLKGISRILGVVGNFLATEKLTLHRDAMSVQVVAKPAQAHCFELLAAFKWVSENPLVSGTLATLAATAITYVFKRAANQREEMKQLRGALDNAIKELGHKDQGNIDRLLSTIERMADALTSSAKSAVAPIGVSANTLTIGPVSSKDKLVIDAETKKKIHAERNLDISDEKILNVLISELDLMNGSCKIGLSGDQEIRYNGIISDPALSIPMSVYAIALAMQIEISVKGKIVTKYDGTIEKIYISDSLTKVSEISPK
jgi:hypothetical protein